MPSDEEFGLKRRATPSGENLVRKHISTALLDSAENLQNLDAELCKSEENNGVTTLYHNEKTKTGHEGSGDENVTNAIDYSKSKGRCFLKHLLRLGCHKKFFIRYEKSFSVQALAENFT